MFKNVFMFLASFITLTSCAVERSEIIKQKDQVCQSHLKKIIPDYDVRVSSFGGGGNGKQFHLMSLGVDTRERLTIDHGRRMIVTMVNDWLTRINNTESLQPYLVTRPFEPKNINYWLNSVNERGTVVEYPKWSEIDNDVISYVVSNGGYIKYNRFVSMEDDIIEVHYETFEEAVEILRKENFL